MAPKLYSFALLIWFNMRKRGKENCLPYKWKLLGASINEEKRWRKWMQWKISIFIHLFSPLVFSTFKLPYKLLLKHNLDCQHVHDWVVLAVCITHVQGLISRAFNWKYHKFTNKKRKYHSRPISWLRKNI